MTEVRVKKQDDSFLFIEIEGHANFSNFGNDVVCSGISSIVFGALNAFMKYELSDSRIIINETFIRINLVEDKTIQIVANTMLIQLKTIQESYPDYISIETV